MSAHVNAHVFFHNDIDGIVTTALFLKASGDADFDDIILHPVQSSQRESFPSILKSIKDEPGNVTCVFDYAYTPNVRPDFWVDHHYNDTMKLLAFDDGQHAYDPSAKSAASVCAKMIIGSGYRKNPIVNNLVSMVDKIDSASYESLSEVFEATDPLMCLSAYLEVEYPSDMMFCRVVEMLVSKHLDVARAMKCLEIDDRYVKKMLEKSAEIKRHIVIFQNFSVIDMQRPNQFPRYSEYYHYPKLKYTVRMNRAKNGDCYVQIGYNQWCGQKNEIDIGAMLRGLSYKKNGGGHYNVGGCTIPWDHRDRFIDDMCINFNPDEVELEKYAVDETDPVEQQATEMIKTGQATDMSDAREQTTKGDPKENAGDTK